MLPVKTYFVSNFYALRNENMVMIQYRVNKVTLLKIALDLIVSNSLLTCLISLILKRYINDISRCKYIEYVLGVTNTSYTLTHIYIIII